MFTSLLGHMTPGTEKHLPHASGEESKVTSVNGGRMFTSTSSLFRSKTKAPTVVVAEATCPHLEEERDARNDPDK